ncbi:hypothetical protein [Nocardia carnea]|uniref:hypothetical protein n=1 Tax=Nocardia carnea TaxID=37328 RepID=UPI00245728AD|nr:hypothetical protein [Nocardia carnea]
MSYPYGQPPHQPGYPAPGPSYPAPAYAAAPGPYGYPQPAPSGGTGITAGILALLGALSSVGMAVSMFILTAATSESSLTNGAALATGARRRSSSSSSSGKGPDIDIDFEGVGIIWGILYLIVALALLVGGIMLLKRSSAGRITVIVACVAFVIISVFGFGLTAIIAGLFAIGTLVLASLGSTKRWIEAGRAPAMAGGYGPAPYGY